MGPQRIKDKERHQRKNIVTNNSFNKFTKIS